MIFSSNLVTRTTEAITVPHSFLFLPVFSKVSERIVYNRVHNHLDSKGLLYEKQFGCQRKN